MYPRLSQLLCDKKGGIIFTCFGPWHLMYMAVIFLVILMLLLRLKRRQPAVRQRAVDRAICLAFVLYIADFFLMPFAYGAIDLEKLPFHVCTAMCVMCFIARKNRYLEKFRLPLAVLALASNLIYTVYPAGIGWYQIHPLSYRAVQTMLFHGTMTAYGILFLAYSDHRPVQKAYWRELLVIVAMTLWAVLGNWLYNGTSGSYSHHFNWFFVTQDPFYMLPSTTAPYIMPFIMVLVMFTAVFLIYTAYFSIQKILRK